MNKHSRLSLALLASISLQTSPLLADLNAVAAVKAQRLNYAIGAARVMDDVAAGNGVVTADMEMIIDLLEPLAPAALAEAVAQFVPVVIGQSAQIALLTSHHLASAVNNRITLQQGQASGGLNQHDGRFWIKLFATDTKQDNHNRIPGYDINSIGVTIGIDGELNEKWLLGGAIAYWETEVDGKTIHRNQIDSESAQLAVYASLTPGDGDFVNLIAVTGMSDNKSRRTIQFSGLNRTAKADYDTFFARLYAGAGHDHIITHQLTLTPLMSLVYTYVEDDDYKEKGASALNLSVKDNDETSLISAFDMLADYQFDDTPFSITGDIGIGYDWLTDRSTLTARYLGGGAAFITAANKPSRWIYHAGIGANTTITETLDATISYQYQGRGNGFHYQIVSANMSWLF